MASSSLAPTGWLNYHHLLYFWTIVREGGVTKAAAKLRLAQPTISAQVRRLEGIIGAKLFERRGRSLALTDVGRIVYRYADDIFPVGQELLETLRGRPSQTVRPLTIGVANAVPKLIVHRLLQPLFDTSTSPFLTCLEDNTEQLIARLAAYEVDMVIADRPAPPHSRVKVFNHLLGSSGTTLFARPDVAARLRRRFPASLTGAAMLMPARSTALRQSLDAWIDRLQLRPAAIAEFEDSALMKAFGRQTGAVFPAPSVIERDVCKLYGVKVAGRAAEVRESYFVLSAERRLSHPSVVALSQRARHDLLDQ